MRSRYWQDHTTTDFAGLDALETLALLPVAAIEQHGPHLPLATDALINRGIVRGMLDRAPPWPTVLVLPPMNVGDSLEHTAFAGTLSISSETLLAAWTDIGRSVARAGLRKLVILNSHGGQIPLVDLAARRLRAETGMLVARANYMRFGMPANLFDKDEIARGLHGGEIETSLMLHLHPELVRADALDNFRSTGELLATRNRLFGVEQPVGFGWMSQDIHPNGVCGNAMRADAERGAQLIEHLCNALITLLREVAEAPLDLLADPHV